MTVLKRRYLAHLDGGGQESPAGMFWRVANNLSQAEWNYEGCTQETVDEWAGKFRDIMAALGFLPNSPTLMNAGRDLQQLSGCFVLPVGDSIEDIFEAVKRTAIIHQSGGGTGFFFGELRPEGSRVKSTGGIASGPSSFIKAFDAATDVVKQGGTRRGANMGILNVDHPDILKFIELKKDGGLENFNISVSVTEVFMDAVLNDHQYDLRDPRTGETTGKTYSAQAVFKRICETAWATGDPGIVFMDKINDANWNTHLGPIQSTNPCGEQPLLPFESCNLGSLNLKLLDTNEKLDRVIPIAVRMLDNVIDMNKYPLPEIEEMTKSTRRIGVGVMGFSDLLIDKHIAYDSEKGLEVAKTLSAYIQKRIHEASETLGYERGSYPARELQGGVPIRNTSPVTIAPTGTISMIAGCSSGIEPIFAPAYVKTVMDGTALAEVHPKLEAFLKQLNIPLLEVAEAGTLKPWMHLIPDDIRMLFRGAGEIHWSVHIEMQAAWQKNTDNAVSKTINTANKATVKDFNDAYLYAHKLGCKGVTIYRDGSKETQVLTQGTATSQNGTAPDTTGRALRPRRLEGYTEVVNTGHGKMYVTPNHLDGQLVEVFATQGKMGGCNGAQMEAIARLVSLGLRRDISLEDIIEQLEGITCCPAFDNGDLIRSNPDGIAVVLNRFLDHHSTPDHNLALSESSVPVQTGKKCHECNGRIIYQEGCEKCLDCGWNKCD